MSLFNSVIQKLKNKITNHPHYGKAKHWTKLVTITGSAQILVQAVGFISGILVIRLLPVDEYALYTLANTMLGTMTILSDGGISTGVMAQGGKVWQDKPKLGAVLVTGLDLRRKFAGFSLIVSLPILAYLLLHHGATWITTILITVSLIPAFYAALSDNLLQIPVKLHQAIAPLQRNQVEVGVGRLLLTGITLFAFPWAFVAIVASGIPRIWGNVRLRRIASGFVDKKTEVDVEEKKEILKVVKKILPGSIYYAISGQITVWLISIFGQTTSVAQLGALGRLSAILSLFSAIFSILVIPRFARLEKNKIKLLKTYLWMFFAWLLVILFVFSIVYLFPNQILWILGGNYAKLNLELLLCIIGSCIMLIAGYAFSTYTSRGWVLNPLISISVSILSVIIGILLFDMSSLKGVLIYNIFLAIIQLIMNNTYLFYKVLKV
ncbi:hypothetical protein FACS1894182_11370 [Bacteroidia bacterium]|nr:hypothetical protein FACS1894182_11370 [Bacteroidia bacterium]